MHLVILTRQIGHYHNARYRAAARVIDKVTVISVTNQGAFPEFLASESGSYGVVRLFPDRASYDVAVSKGKLGDALRALLDRTRPDVVAVAGWTTPESVAAISWCSAKRVPIVMMSESQADDAKRSPFRELVKSRIVSLCQAALVGGPPHASYVIRLGIPAERVFFGYNAVDNDYFATGAAAARKEPEAVRAALGLPRKYLLASARFIEKKNLSTLVGAYAIATQTSIGERPHLVILGDGDLRSKIVSAAHEVGVADCVHLPGFRGYDVLPAFYGLAEGFVHVSTVEQWGLVVNEAMAAGVPVIVSEPCGVARALIDDGVNGFVVEPTERSIACGIARLLAMDPRQREELVARSVETIANWGPARFGAEMEAAVWSAWAVQSRRNVRPWDVAILKKLEKSVIERVL